MTTLSNIFWPTNQGDSILHAWHLDAKSQDSLPGYLHSHRILHRDVKPSNVMVSVSGHLELVDLKWHWVFMEIRHLDFLHKKAGVLLRNFCHVAFGDLISMCAVICFCKKMQAAYMWWYVCIFLQAKWVSGKHLYESIYLYIEVYVYYYYIIMYLWMRMHSGHSLIVVKQDLRLHHSFEGRFDGE